MFVNAVKCDGNTWLVFIDITLLTDGQEQKLEETFRLLSPSWAVPAKFALRKKPDCKITETAMITLVIESDTFDVHAYFPFLHEVLLQIFPGAQMHYQVPEGQYVWTRKIDGSAGVFNEFNTHR